VSGSNLTNALIWDAEGSPPEAEGTTVLWRGFADGVTLDIVSIPSLIEENADTLRSRYLAWVYELGELRLQGRRLVDHLQLSPCFNYWWMTLLVEKCNYEKSPQIEGAIRLLAFSDWAAGRGLEHITLVSANQPLAECLRRWCDRCGLAFKWQRLSEPAAPMSWARRAFNTFPAAMQAWVWLLTYLLDRWPLWGVGLQGWQQGAGSVSFVSYLMNLVPDAAQEGRYESRYWGTLPEVLQRKGCKTNWLHLYSKDAFLTDAKKAAGIIRSLNSTGRGMQIHVTLDTFFSARIVRQVLSDWLKLVVKGKRLKGLIATSCTTKKEPLDLWPLFEKDWRESMFGAAAMSNALHRRLFEAAMKPLPKQNVGCYLQENQSWEFALIQNWRMASHGRLIGVPHSSVRFWDLRYFFDPRSYNQTQNKPMPLPDQVAVNGNAATEAYLRGGYPADNLVQVEALRYLSLNNANIRSASEASGVRRGLRVLVLGDYLASNTRLQMYLLMRAAKSLPSDIVLTVKPHPACPIDVADYPELRLTVETRPVSELLAKCDVAYTSAVTSAAVDAYCSGVQVISVIDPNTLNMSPVRGYAGVYFASTSDELVRALTTSKIAPPSHNLKNAFFTIDRRLPRWQKLLMAY
jgi:surface carbohydrate biosynthesis protein (TIGR04326 family)